jgi:hypothetical protein
MTSYRVRVAARTRRSWFSLDRVKLSFRKAISSLDVAGERFGAAEVEEAAEERHRRSGWAVRRSAARGRRRR